MMKSLAFISCLLLFSIGFAEKEAQDTKGKPTAKSMMDPGKFMKEEIGLSQDQEKKLDAIRLANAREMENCRHEIEVEKLAVKEAAVKGTINKAVLKESLKKIEDARNKMHAARYQGALSVIDIFTEEQLKKIADKKMMNIILEGREGRDGRGDHEDRECPKGMEKKCPMMEKK